MDIVFQSLVAERSSGEKALDPSISHIIIRKQFSQFEQRVRDNFSDLPQVRVIVDRRWHIRRRQGDDVLNPPQERRKCSDRRCVVPALDIIMGGID